MTYEKKKYNNNNTPFAASVVKSSNQYAHVHKMFPNSTLIVGFISCRQCWIEVSQIRWSCTRWIRRIFIGYINWVLSTLKHNTGNTTRGGRLSSLPSLGIFIMQSVKLSICLLSHFVALPSNLPWNTQPRHFRSTMAFRNKYSRC